MFDPIFTAKKDANDSLLIDLSTEVEGLDIHYSFDNSHPDNYYPVYKAPLGSQRCRYAESGHLSRG